MICHPTTPCNSVEVLQATAQLTLDGGLKLNYILCGDLENIIIPIKQKKTQADGLWEHTCFEAFACIQGESWYYEYNFSPSTQWAAYAFSDYREPIDWVVEEAPQIGIEQSRNTLLLEIILSKNLIPKIPYNKLLQLGLTAVVESADGSKSYWALKHCADRPDFHNKNGFILNV